MKTARLVVLGIAVVAGGAATLLAGRSDTPPPVVAIDTVEILVAKREIKIGQSIQAADMGWVARPAESASSLFVRRADHADAIEQLAGAIARTPIATDEPLRESKLTLESTQRQAETLAIGRHMGSLSLALRSPVDRSKGGADVPEDAVPSNRANIVRFGVSTTAITK